MASSRKRQLCEMAKIIAAVAKSSMAAIGIESETSAKAYRIKM
jgi:hypothetical protein